MIEMIDDNGKPTPDFKDMVSATVTNWINYYDREGVKTQFIVMAVQEKSGRTSYWGLIDVENTPREDLYVEIERRFYCAYRTIGQKEIFGVGLLDVLSVLDRIQLPQAPEA